MLLARQTLRAGGVRAAARYACRRIPAFTGAKAATIQTRTLTSQAGNNSHSTHARVKQLNTPEVYAVRKGDGITDAGAERDTLALNLDELDKQNPVFCGFTASFCVIFVRIGLALLHGWLRVTIPVTFHNTERNHFGLRIVTEFGDAMQDLSILNELIDRAAAVAGSDYKLAQLMEVPRQQISNWRHGHKTAQPEDVAILASVAGLEADRWALRAMVAKHEGTAKGDRLLKALGKGLLATGAVLASSGASAAAIFSATSSGSGTLAAVLAAYSTMYRKVKLLNALTRTGSSRFFFA